MCAEIKYLILYEWCSMLCKFFKEQTYLESLQQFWWNLTVMIQSSLFLNNWFRTLLGGAEELPNKYTFLMEAELNIIQLPLSYLFIIINYVLLSGQQRISSGGRPSISAPLHHVHLFDKVQIQLFWNKTTTRTRGPSWRKFMMNNS